jgi:hypothetical protein
LASAELHRRQQPADALASLFNAGSGSNAAGSSPLQIAQTMFSQIDSNDDGSISKTEVEQAVTAAGGTAQGADALFAQLDPGNTGSVSQPQFIQALRPPSPSDLAMAVSLYQAQIGQQLFGTVLGTSSTGV